MSEENAAGTQLGAESLFADFLERRERDQTLDFSSFAAAHPAREAELLALERNWHRVGGLLGRLTPSDPGKHGAVQADSLRQLELRARLAERITPFARYRLGRELGRGGMGSILSSWDEDIGREVAMKVLLEDEVAFEADASRRVRRVARFLEEAQITGQLDHPCIVPVYDLGVSDRGQLYFTQKLVRGRELRLILKLVREQQEGWNLTRALGVLQRVCEAMAFAHERGVIHRDLKPANIMIGSHGESYIVDWGLARVLHNESATAVQAQTHSENAKVHSHRRASTPHVPDSELATADGEILGTPQYMSPEQARGDHDSVGRQSDIYAVGAILYELLSGAPPYVGKGKSALPRAVWNRVLAGPPEALASICPHQPPELIAICEKAMARDIAARYAAMTAMAEDLRAYLENRVVRAHKTGAWVELYKWMQRNRSIAWLLAALLLVVTGGGFIAAWLEHARQRERVGRLAEAYLSNYAKSWPLDPRSAPALKSWLSGVGDLQQALPGLRAKLLRLREHGQLLTEDTWPLDPELLDLRQSIAEAEHVLQGYPGRIVAAEQELATAQGQDLESMAPLEREQLERQLLIAEAELELLPPEIQRAEDLLRRLQPQLARFQRWSFVDSTQQAEHDHLALAVQRLEQLLVGDFSAVNAVQAQLDRAYAIEQESLVAAAEQWSLACASIADRSQCPLYDGLVLQPQYGLVPLARNPTTGLWEFWHVASGAAPQPQAEGMWRITPETGIVLILVPGGDVWIGAQGDNPSQPNFDAYKFPLHGPGLHELSLAPYFLGKYELTQAQYERLGGGRPSTRCVGFRIPGSVPIRATHPVESVARDEALAVLAHFGLGLPTGAQWERAARAGGTAPYGAYTSSAELPLLTNAADKAYIEVTGLERGVWQRDDGWGWHAPVSENEQNPWGFLGIYGNVCEWTCDLSNREDVGDAETEARLRIISETGERVPPFGRMQTYRGGSYSFRPDDLRPTFRWIIEAGSRREIIGIRPARRLDPLPSSLSH